MVNWLFYIRAALQYSIIVAPVLFIHQFAKHRKFFKAMRIGVPKEIKTDEFRVGLVPGSVRELVEHGHEVAVETNAGVGISASDDDYRSVGATVLGTPKEVFDFADLIIKVKEPLEQDRKLLREKHILFTYLHLAPDPVQTKDLVESGATCIAYETVTEAGGGLPLLAPMSKVAGRMAVQEGAWCLERPHGGTGMLLGGVPGVEPAKIVIIGGGVVGTHATHIGVGMGADVWVLDRNVAVLDHHWAQFGRATNTLYSTRSTLEKHVVDADLVIGAVLIPGGTAPRLVTEEMIRKMRPGSVVVDVAIDQGGCFETSRATTHSDPTYRVHNVTHYCVTNIPGAVPRTSTYALNNVVLPFAVSLANNGYKDALRADPHLQRGLNIHKGKVTCEEVARALNYDYVPALDALEIH